MEPNPLVPTAYEMIWTLIAAAALVLLFFGLRAWFRTAFSSRTTALLMFLAVWFLPVVGPLVMVMEHRRLKSQTSTR